MKRGELRTERRISAECTAMLSSSLLAFDVRTEKMLTFQLHVNAHCEHLFLIFLLPLASCNSNTFPSFNFVVQKITSVDLL